MNDKTKFAIFQTTDKSLTLRMFRSEWLQRSLNKTPIWRVKKRNRIIKKLFGSIDGNPYLVYENFRCCYGDNIHVGKNFFANYNCVIMDHADVNIGDNVLIAPNVHILTVSHSLDPKERRVHEIENSFEPEGRGNFEVIAPITIGDDVWIGAGSTICAGVTIGSGSVIGAGSVVTRDIPANTFAVGIPCRVLREITEEDRFGIDA